MDNLTVVIPFYNGHQHISALLASLPAGLPTIIVDDLSDVPLRQDDVTRHDTTVVRLREKGYFTGAVNAALSRLRTDVLVLNQDTVLEGTGLLDLIASNRARYGLIGERIAGDHPAWPNGYIHGVCMFVRRDVIERVGVMDAEHWPLWGSTCDYQLRACRAGFGALPVSPLPGLTHHRNGRFGSSIEDVLRREPDKRDLLVRTPPLVSVIINCYNYGRYLPDAIASLIGGKSSLGDSRPQTFQGFEVIIVDDASTDNSFQVAQSLADDWKGIHAIRRSRNGGTAAANNTGIEVAHGKYIAILCADDMMAPERLARMLALQEANPRRFIYDDVKIMSDGKFSKRWKMLPEFDLSTIIHKNGIHAGIMVPRQALKEVGGYPEVMRFGREDWAINIALGLRGWCGLHLDYPGYYYRREGQNRTLSNTSPDWHQRFVSQLVQLYPDAYAGRDDMPCCGGRRGAAAKPASRRAPAAFSASAVPTGRVNGMVLIQYVGGNMGDGEWIGPVTKTAYRFGGTHPIGYVNDQDAADMLAIRINRRETFKRYTPPPQVVEVKEPEPIVEPEPEPVPEPEPEPVPEPVVAEMVGTPAEADEPIILRAADFPPDYNPDEMTVAEVGRLVRQNDLAPHELRQMLAIEERHKNRRTVLSLLREALGNAA